MHQSSLLKLTDHTENFHWMTELKRHVDSERFLTPLSRLQKLTVLNSPGHWHQRFDRALSWYMVLWCNLSKQKFNATKLVWFQTPSHTSLPDYRGNIKHLKNKSMMYLCLWLYPNYDWISKKFQMYVSDEVLQLIMMWNCTISCGIYHPFYSYPEKNVEIFNFSRIQ